MALGESYLVAIDELLLNMSEQILKLLAVVRTGTGERKRAAAYLAVIRCRIEGVRKILVANAVSQSKKDSPAGLGPGTLFLPVAVMN